MSVQWPVEPEPTGPGVTGKTSTRPGSFMEPIVGKRNLGWRSEKIATRAITAALAGFVIYEGNLFAGLTLYVFVLLGTFER